MANHKSALKRANQNEVRRLRNKAVRTRVKNVTKDLRLAVKDNYGSKISELLNIVKSIIDKATKKGVLHKKTASRKISRLTRMSNQIKTST